MSDYKVHGGAPPYIPPIPPSLPLPACLQHMSPPIVAMATPPHVADRMREKRGRGGENTTEGKGRVGEEEMEEKKKSVEEDGGENEGKTTFQRLLIHAEPANVTFLL